MRLLAALAVAALACTGAHAEDADLAGLFEAMGLRGTMVLSRLEGGPEFIHDAARAATPLPPASTFKIFNALIALEEGVITGPDEVLVWDGRVRELPDWNRDHDLASAYRVSCVWCYQELARRIGAERYRVHLRTAGYGRLSEPFDATNFWLDGSLLVSARDQVGLLRRIIERALPYREASYAALRDLMVVERNDQYTMRAKTGWAARTTPQLGWYVGYVEKPDVVWIFATNIDLRDEADLPLRRELTLRGLRAKGIIR
ncbi:MAG: class D beta-lactamase [Thiobacillaceae bacterium]|jgi:beta-lactamase class D|nr:class D beta-lactamase [Thiobacillaceae bacterium]